MKSILLFLFTFTLVACKAQILIPDSAKFYVDSGEVVVCGKVSETYLSVTGNTFLNFGVRPNFTFAAAVFEKDSVKFDFKPSDFFWNKNVCITGLIKMYLGRPQIIIKSPNQIVVK